MYMCWCARQHGSQQARDGVRIVGSSIRQPGRGPKLKAPLPPETHHAAQNTNSQEMHQSMCFVTSSCQYSIPGEGGAIMHACTIP
eukprot:360794-Chlamydomonas_euryale.AAC.6